METLDCRSPRACATCEHALRSGACGLEAQLDLALDALAGVRPHILVTAALRAAA